jgi:hypothetical protein
MMAELNREVASFKEVGPYVQMVISFVPGIGQGISGAMGVALALANGQPIDKALIAGVESALPGGPLARMAFTIVANVADAAIQGKPINAGTLVNAGVQGVLEAANIHLPKGVVEAITTAISVGGDIIGGKKPEAALLAHANGFLAAGADLVPGLDDAGHKAIKGALGIGFAVFQATALQTKAKTHLQQATVAAVLAKDGAHIASGNMTIAAAASIIPGGGHGFQVGIGLMAKQTGPFGIRTIRDSLTGDDRKAFDVAVSVHVAAVVTPIHKVDMMPASAQAGFLVTKGMQGAPATNKAVLMTAVAEKPEARAGAVVAIKIIANRRDTLVHRILRAVGLAA